MIKKVHEMKNTLWIYRYENARENIEKIGFDGIKKTKRFANLAEIKFEIINVEIYDDYSKNLIDSGYTEQEFEPIMPAMIGRGSASVWESNIQMHAVYGTPVIHGESIRGAVRAYASSHLDPEYVNALFGASMQDSQMPGVVRFADAWAVPTLNENMYCLEIDATHEKQYHKDQKPPAVDGLESPEPINHLATQCSFNFPFQIRPIQEFQRYEEIKKLVKDLLAETLFKKGLGSNINVDQYGRFKPVAVQEPYLLPHTKATSSFSDLKILKKR